MRLLKTLAVLGAFVLLGACQAEPGFVGEWTAVEISDRHYSTGALSLTPDHSFSMTLSPRDKDGQGVGIGGQWIPDRPHQATLKLTSKPGEPGTDNLVAHANEDFSRLTVTLPAAAEGYLVFRRASEMSPPPTATRPVGSPY